MDEVVIVENTEKKRGRPKRTDSQVAAAVEKKEQTNAADYPDWVLTTTSNGTPIAIDGICPIGNTGDHEFLVIPDYRNKNKDHRTSVKSEDVVRPTAYPTPEVEKMFEGIKFWIPPAIPAVEQKEVASA